MEKEEDNGVVDRLVVVVVVVSDDCGRVVLHERLVGDSGECVFWKNRGYCRSLPYRRVVVVVTEDHAATSTGDDTLPDHHRVAVAIVILHDDTVRIVTTGDSCRSIMFGLLVVVHRFGSGCTIRSSSGTGARSTLNNGRHQYHNSNSSNKRDFVWILCALVFGI